MPKHGDGKVSDLGFRVDRATDTLPQSTSEALFAITGGRVILTLLLGEVTTALGAGTTPDMKVVFNPTAAGASTDLSANNDMAAAAVGFYFSITGTITDITQKGILTGATLERQVILGPGTVDVAMDESVAGSVKWTLCYMPVDAGATVTATAV